MKKEGKYRALLYSVILAVLVLMLAAGAPALEQEKKPAGSDPSSGASQYQQKETKTDQQQAQQKSDQQQAQQKSDQQQAQQKSDQPQARQQVQTERLTEYKPIVGREVRNTRGDEIGEIDNIVVSQDGKQIQAVVSVGGFLGMGAKSVLVSLNELQFQAASDFVFYPGTQQDLERLAEYKEPDAQRRYADRPYYPGERRGFYGYPEGREPDYGDRGFYSDDRFGRYPEDRYGRGYYEDRGGRAPYGDRFGGRYEDRFREDERYGRGYGQQDDRRSYRQDERSDRGYMMRERGPMGGPMMRDDDSRTYGRRYDGREDGRYSRENRSDRGYESYGRQ